MSINNDVFSVLVTKGNQNVAVKNTSVSALLPNQIGAFDANTNLAVDGTTPVRDFYLAVGLDRDADGAIDDLRKSAGQLIQSKNIRSFDFKPHTAGRPQIMTMTGMEAFPATSYSLKLEFRNQEVYRIQGTNQFSRGYAVTTKACSTCVSGNVPELTMLMKAAINADAKGLVKAEVIAVDGLISTTHGTSVNISAGVVISDADVLAVVAYNDNVANALTKVKTGLKFTSVPLKLNNFASVNLKYFKPRETVMIISATDGFNGLETFATTQEVAFEQGLGYDIQQKEYIAGGWNGNAGVYRTSGTTHTASNVEYFAEKAVAYDQFAIAYDHNSVAGFAEHNNHLATILAIPAADVATRGGLVTILDGLMPAGFNALADDVATSNVNPAIVESMDALTDATDGVA